MRRREFITLLGGTVAGWPPASRAQQLAMPVIGYLSSLTEADSVRFDAAFRRGLSEMGYNEGQNISIEYRWITDRYDPLPVMAGHVREALYIQVLPVSSRFLRYCLALKWTWEANGKQPKWVPARVRALRDE